MSKTTKQIAQLKRMLVYRQERIVDLHENSYLHQEIAALINAIESMELIVELGWEYILTTRLTRKANNEKESAPTAPDGITACKDQSGDSLCESSASMQGE